MSFIYKPSFPVPVSSFHYKTSGINFPRLQAIVVNIMAYSTQQILKNPCRLPQRSAVVVDFLKLLFKA